MITTPPLFSPWRHIVNATFSAPAHLNHLHLFVLSAFITGPLVSPVSLSLWPVSSYRCDPYFLLVCVYHFKHLWEKLGGFLFFLFSVSQMSLVPLLSSVWVKLCECILFRGYWYPGGGRGGLLTKQTPHSLPYKVACHSNTGGGKITNVTHTAIRLPEPYR